MFVSLLTNSLLPNIDEFREIAKTSNAAVIGINDSKLDINDFDFPQRLQCNVTSSKEKFWRCYKVLVCYVKNNIFFSKQRCLSNKIKNIFIKLLLAIAKPTTIGIIHKLPDQLKFLETLSDSLNALTILNKE